MSQPIVKQQMLFRVPVERVFEAFADPELTTKFWFTHSDGRLETGRTVTWEWRMYGCSTQVSVLQVKPNELIRIEWGEDEARSNVEWLFAARSDGTTLVTITNDNFSGDDESMVSQAIESMGGFSFVLANAKAFLEHDIELKLIHDHAPDAHVTQENVNQ